MSVRVAACVGIPTLEPRALGRNTTPVKLAAHRYGKSRVRVMKVLRDGATHTVKELTVAVALEGDFDASFTDADNAEGRARPTR